MSNITPFARRTDWPLTSNALSKALERLREEKKPLLDLTQSNPTLCGFSYYQNNIVTPPAGEENLRYMPSPHGSLQARRAVCAYYQEKGHDISPEQVFLTASTSEAYTYLFRLLVDPGGQTLFPRPGYPLFAFLGDLNDVHMDTYPLVYKNQWHIDINGMRAALGAETKSIVLVNPNNPTGSFIQHEELKQMNALCKDRHLALICDEVFSDFAFDQTKDRLSLVDNDRVLTFVLGGISKTLGLPQMKLSWIVVNGPRTSAEAAGARLEVIADTYLSVNTPAQNALPVWMRRRETIQKEIRARIIQNHEFLKEHTGAAAGCELLAAEGGWYAVLRIPDTLSEEQWALTFLNKDRVIVHPGYFFDFDTEAFIVVSLLPAEDVFQEGVTRILERVKSHKI